jgi:hypothetical protein
VAFEDLVQSVDVAAFNFIHIHIGTKIIITKHEVLLHDIKYC